MCGCSVENGEYRHQLTLEAVVECAVEAEAENENETGNRLKGTGFVEHFDNGRGMMGPHPPPRLQ